MYAVVPAKVFSSIDNGLHWTLVSGLTLWGYHNILQQKNGDIIMLNSDVLYTSSDNGQSFRFLVSMGLTSNTTIFYIDSQNYFYATGFDNQYRMILYRSKDQGENWEKVFTVPSDPNMSIQQFSEIKGTTYFATAVGLQKTTDFKNYTIIAPELTSKLRSYLIKDDGGMVMGTTTGSLYYYIP